MHQALQGISRGCKSCISKGYSFLRVAPHCTVLRSRWCQSGVNPRKGAHSTESSKEGKTSLGDESAGALRPYCLAASSRLGRTGSEYSENQQQCHYGAGNVPQNVR